MDQVMDARDVSGCLYRINKRGGFGKATLEEKVDFGFAAFGVVPEMGSAVKTVFKPLYKQRKRAKGVINGGVAMIERMLGHKKGGAVRWVRTLDWAGKTQMAIVQANAALESCIAMLDYLGQSHWWLPDRIERLARDVAPGLKAMRGKLAAPIREAAAEIRKFLEEMLGEHAAAVAMSVAGSGGTRSRTPTRTAGVRSRQNNAAQSHKDITGKARTAGKPAHGRTASVIQVTAYDLYKGLDFALKGLMGEHIVEHHVIEKKGWGLEWNRHDMVGPARGTQASGWQGEYRKLNDGGIPLYLCTPTGHVLTNGIDSLWYTSRPIPGQYAVVEAKANMNPKTPLYHLLGEAKAGGTSREKARGRRSGVTSGGQTAGQAMAKGKAKSNMVMQMSKRWIEDRIDAKFPRLKARMIENYSRHVFLVSPEQATEHIRAAEKIISNGFVNRPAEAQQFAAEHANHEVEREFGEQDIDAAEAQYKRQGRYKKPVKPATKKRGAR
jgi:hypothetical protein